MSTDADGHLAPVIPLFGGSAPADPAEQRPIGDRGRGSRGGGRDSTAADGASITPEDDGGWHTTWTAPGAPGEFPADTADAEGRDVREAAENRLLKKLRVRSLSERESRTFLREQDLDPAAIEHVIDALVRHGYLDDARLAEQLIHAGVTRKGQGRAAISLALSQRGIPRDVADVALAELEDDDAERALEFARQKARAMRGLDRETAVRRLAGQLSRRGYGGFAVSAARRALDELDRPAARGVRFE